LTSPSFINIDLSGKKCYNVYVEVNIAFASNKNQMVKRNSKILASVGVLALFLLCLVFLVGYTNAFVEKTDKTEVKAEVSDTDRDTTPPHIPQGLSVKALDGKLELSWRGNIKEDEVEKYLIYIRTGAEKQDNNPIAVKADKTKYLIKNIGSSMYYISLAAQDKSGNVSGQTTEIGMAPNASGSNNFQVTGWMP